MNTGPLFHVIAVCSRDGICEEVFRLERLVQRRIQKGGQKDARKTKKILRKSSGCKVKRREGPVMQRQCARAGRREEEGEEQQRITDGG